jgi:uncharacterized protein YdeI (BOF family)
METKHAAQRIIKDIKNDDTRIQVTGFIKEIIKDNQIILKDKTGQLKVSIADVDFTFKKDDLVNIIGDLNISMNGEKVLRAQIIQDMKNLNFPYYLKLYELKKELE